MVKVIHEFKNKNGGKKMNERLLAIGVIVLIMLIISIVGVPVVKVKGHEENTRNDDCWTTKSDMPTARYTLGVASIDDKIYAFGGNSGVTSLEKTLQSAVECYHIGEKKWYRCNNITINNKTISLFGMASVSLNGKIYSIGGFGLYAMSPVLCYDPKSDNWSYCRTPSNSYIDPDAVVLDGKIYVLGDVSTSSSVECFNPIEGNWSFCTNIPTPRKYFSATVTQNKIYVIGGRDENNNTIGSVECYDPYTNAWMNCAEMPTARECLNSITVGEKIFAIGGSRRITFESSSYHVFVDTVECFDPINNSWSTCSNMPTERAGAGVATVSGSIYVIGGSDNNGNSLHTVECYNPSLDLFLKNDLSDTPTESSDNNEKKTPGFEAFFLLAGILVAIIYYRKK